MPSFAKGGNKRLFNNKIIGIYIFFNIFNICVLYIHCTHSEYMWGGVLNLLDRSLNKR